MVSIAEHPVKRLIRERGYMQKYIAEVVLGISQQNLWNKLNRDTRFFSADEQRRLADFFNVPIGELFPKAERDNGQDTSL